MRTGRLVTLAILALAGGTAAACATGRASAGGPVRLVVGHSVKGRPIVAFRLGAPGGVPVLVVGCIHGNEQAGIAITAALLHSTPPPGVDLWIVPVLNPDGKAAHTRANAEQVDLNRNFPAGWQKLVETGGETAGRGPLSEPETRAAYALLTELKPHLSIWFHQALAVVDDSLGSTALERRFARLVGLPLHPLTDYPGSITRWETAALWGSSFVVELRAGSLTAAQAQTYADAVLAVSGL